MYMSVFKVLYLRVDITPEVSTCVKAAQHLATESENANFTSFFFNDTNKTAFKKKSYCVFGGYGRNRSKRRS